MLVLGCRVQQGEGEGDADTWTKKVVVSGDSPQSVGAAATALYGIFGPTTLQVDYWWMTWLKA